MTPRLKENLFTYYKALKDLKTRKANASFLTNTNDLEHGISYLEGAISAIENREKFLSVKGILSDIGF